MPSHFLIYDMKLYSDEGPLTAADFQMDSESLDGANQKATSTKFTRKFTKSVYANDTSNILNSEVDSQKQNIFVENREQVESENKKILSGYELQEKKQAWARKAESKHQEVLSRLRSQKSAGEVRTENICKTYVMVCWKWSHFWHCWNERCHSFIYSHYSVFVLTHSLTWTKVPLILRMRTYLL